MSSKNMRAPVLVVIFLIVVAAFTRLLPHPPNFTPILSMAIIGGFYLRGRLMQFLVPIAAMVLSDAFIGFHSLMIFTYGAVALTVLLSLFFSSGGNKNYGSVVLSSLTGSVVFFVVTNFAVWMFSGMYPLNLGGLSTCFVAAIPFFQNTLTSTLLFSSVLYAAVWYAAKVKLPAALRY